MKAKPNILIIGQSGSGKSSSLANLPPGETALIDLERKGLPFLMPTPFIQHSEPENLTEANAAIEAAARDEKVRIIVIDSLMKYSELAAYHALEIAKLKGWDVQNFHNAQIGKFFELLRKSMKVYIVTDLDEIVWIETAEGNRVSRQRAAITYRFWEGKIEKEFLITAVCDVRMVNNKPVHSFRTVNDGIGPAKCPPFVALPANCPNDANLIIDALRKANLI